MQQLCNSRRTWHGSAKPAMICSHSNIVEESHKTKVHVQLLMTVEQSHTRIVSYEVHFVFLVASQHHDVFENASRRSPGQAGQFEAVPVQMNRMYIVTPNTHAKTIAFPLFQVKCGRRRFIGHWIRDAIDRPAVESSFRRVVFRKSHLHG